MKKILLLLASAFVGLTANAALSETDFANNNYINEWGRLKLVGNQLSSESGQPVQLKGWSSFGWMSNWGDCHSDGHLDQMKAWGASIYRGAMYIGEGGYSNGNQNLFTEMTKHFIDYTAKIGMYYLCDWHVLTPGNPTDGTYSDAPNYFRTISEYVSSKGYKHVIYEICNEPNGVSWSEIKSYADQILPIIAQNDPGACVVVGTPQWDQNINEAQQSPIDKNKYNLNILYTFHYYSCSHQQFLPRLESAAGSIPVFITEWGIADFSGGEGSRDVAQSCYTSADELINKANGAGSGQKISWCAWSFGEKNEQASSLMSCGSMELSNTGKAIVEYIGGNSDIKPTLSACYENTCQAVPGVVDLGKYDVNPEGGKEDMGFGKVGDVYVGGGEGVTYHEENTVSDEVNTRSKCNGAYMWAGEDYAFRLDECVDASGCYGLTGAEGWHNLGYVEPGEWIVITVDVVQSGYYTLRGLGHFGTQWNFSVGSLSYNCNLLVDMDNNDEPLSSVGISNINELGKPIVANYGDSDNWMHWDWLEACNNIDDCEPAPNYAILFKEPGKHQIKLTFLTGEDIEGGGDLGPLEFTFAKPYTGPGYDKQQDGTKVESVASASGVELFPNPANDVISANVEASKIEVVSLTGAVIASANGNSVNIASLATGSYIAKIYTANGVVVKNFVKK